MGMLDAVVQANDVRSDSVHRHGSALIPTQAGEQLRRRLMPSLQRNRRGQISEVRGRHVNLTAGALTFERAAVWKGLEHCVMRVPGK